MQRIHRPTNRIERKGQRSTFFFPPRDDYPDDVAEIEKAGRDQRQLRCESRDVRASRSALIGWREVGVTVNEFPIAAMSPADVRYPDDHFFVWPTGDACRTA